MRAILVRVAGDPRQRGSDGSEIARFCEAAGRVNLVEGSGSSCGTRNARCRTALGSAEPLLLQELDQVRAILVRVTM